MNLHSAKQTHQLELVELSVSGCLFALCAFFWAAVNTAEAERVNICSKVRYAQASGVHCNYTTKPGEYLKATGTYYDTSPDSATVRLSPFGESVAIPAGQTSTVAHFVRGAERTAAQVLFSIVNFDQSGGDYLDLETWADRSNLSAKNASVNSSDGTLNYGYNVTTTLPFKTENYVTLQLWAGNNGNRSQFLLEKQLGDCINKGNCSQSYDIPLTSRPMINRGYTDLISIIDAGDQHAETSEADNVQVRFLDDFFVERIPGIMANLGTGWDVGSAFLNRWFDTGRAIKNSSTDSFDWTLARLNLISTEWLLVRSNASDSRIIDKFNQILQPGYFANSMARTVLRERIIRKFASNPGARSLPLSTTWTTGQNIRSYHEQQMQFIQAQTGYGGSPLDAITGAFGNFSFYLVPLGTAEILDATYYRIKIQKVAVHVSDSFDFNGDQPLGCWAEPNHLGYSGGQCVNNSSLRYYRNMKARGYDYIVFTTPKIVTLPSELIFRLRR